MKIRKQLATAITLTLALGATQAHAGWNPFSGFLGNVFSGDVPMNTVRAAEAHRDRESAEESAYSQPDDFVNDVIDTAARQFAREAMEAIEAGESIQQEFDQHYAKAQTISQEAADRFFATFLKEVVSAKLAEANSALSVTEHLDLARQAQARVAASFAD